MPRHQRSPKGAFAVHRHLEIGLLAVVFGLIGVGSASAQQNALQPIPAGECQQIAGQIQQAISFAMKTDPQEDFTDVIDGSEGHSCHISGSASDQTFATPADLLGKITPVFGGDWRNEPSRAADGPDGTERGLVKGNRIATVDVNWEPGAGASCSPQQPLSACKILPQQKLWSVTVDIVDKAGR
jgi:hypothetical protein